MKTYSFENLDVWKESRKLVLMIYQLQNSFPSYEKYGLGDQLRRAAVSVSSNIVEGNYRFSIQEQIRFIEISFGSLMEVYCQLILAFDMNYIDEHQMAECKIVIEKIRQMLIALCSQKKETIIVATRLKRMTFCHIVISIHRLIVIHRLIASSSHRLIVSSPHRHSSLHRFIVSS